MKETTNGNLCCGDSRASSEMVKECLIRIKL